MMSLEAYKVLHLLGVFMIVFSLGGLCLHVMNGGVRKHSARMIAALTHGVGMLFTLVAGFGMLARLGISHASMPGWVMAKFIIWFFLGASMALVYRLPAFSRALWFLIVGVATLGAYLGIMKP